MKQEVKKERKSGRAIYLVIILLLSAACAYLGWKYWQEKNRADKVEVRIKEVFIERDNVKGQLLELQEEYAKLQTNDAKLQSELDERRAEIAKLIEEAEKYKGNEFELRRLRKELSTLREIMKGYIKHIDSLNTVNQQLVAEKGQITQELTLEKGKTAQLSQEKTDLQGVVNMAQLLKAYNINAVGVRYKSGGKKEITTDKAKRVEKLKVSVTLGENKISKKGSKTIFVRIVTPDGQEMFQEQDDSNMFMFNGSKGFFAGKHSFDYNQNELEVVVYCDNTGQEYVPGKYIIEIGQEGAIIGSSTMTLK